MAASTKYQNNIQPIAISLPFGVDVEADGADPFQKRVLVLLLSLMIVMPLTVLGLYSLGHSGAHTAFAAPAEEDAPPALPVGAETSGGVGGVATTSLAAAGALAQIFAPEVLHWTPQIVQWAAAYDLDPNLVAIIMQVESCGDPGAVSSAGAQGLFQVMPFHFTAGENMTDPDTNARRGLNYFVEGLRYHSGDIGRTFAGYNGGHGTSAKNWSLWPSETQRYYTWTTGIYEDIQAGLNPSPTLEAWLAAGGAGLCQQAANRLDL
jgi:hypothetical protein